MTIISSGGFLPFNNIDLILNTNLKKIVFSLLMLFSFFSLFLSYNLIFLKKKKSKFFCGRYLFINLFNSNNTIFFNIS